MGRYRRFHRKVANRDKYSIEQTVVQTDIVTNWATVPHGQDATLQDSKQIDFEIVPPVDFQGMRKVKHLDLTVSNDANDTVPLLYALVYVPHGVDISPIRFPAPGYANTLYHANQFVMACGVLDFGAGPCRIRCPLSRNLNSGDRIVLICASAVLQLASKYIFNVRYAITLQ